MGSAFRSAWAVRCRRSDAPELSGTASAHRVASGGATRGPVGPSVRARAHVAEVCLKPLGRQTWPNCGRCQ